MLEFLKSTELIEHDNVSDGEFEEGEQEIQETMLKYELLRFRKMSTKMRSQIYEDESEQLFAASNRTGSDCEMFWNTKKSVFPMLASVYLKLLVTPASSSMVESSFLFLKNIQQGRTQLSENHLDDILQLFFDQKI